MHRESSVHPHVPFERADLFATSNGEATEHEYIRLIRAMVRATKPARLLETGTFRGDTTIELARATVANGFGHIVTLDVDQDHSQRACEMLAREVPHASVECITRHSMDYLRDHTTQPFQFAFLDSLIPTRAEELGLLLDRNLLPPGAIVMIHDTSRMRVRNDGTPDPDTSDFWTRFVAVRRRHQLTRVIELPLSRGMLMIQVGGCP
ncbi:MAG: class I SAM-dependent methyltransferase [Planctomycetota bacterium]|nr:class I SAM-dependent methyltransferase [Planctomycetota bacterium]